MLIVKVKTQKGNNLGMALSNFYPLKVPLKTDLPQGSGEWQFFFKLWQF